MDFCMSLTMLFQNQYNVITTTDINLLSTIVKSIKPSLVIADTQPSDELKNRIDDIHLEIPELPVILFCVSSQVNKYFEEKVCKSVNAYFFKPVDINELSNKIKDLTE